ncbi:hypothetical protein D9M71_615750 [compost metagenome]
MLIRSRSIGAVMVADWPLRVVYEIWLVPLRMSPLKVTFWTLPPSTWSRNCEYVAPWAPAPLLFGEKLWNTTMSTTATTTHSRRFLVKSFILIGSGVPLMPDAIGMVELT